MIGRPAGQRSRHGVDPRHLERLVARERRQDARQAATEHRLARARRPGEENVVLARGGELERPPPALLAPHLREIGHERLLELVASRRGGERDLLLAAEVGDRLREVVDGDDVDAGESGLRTPTRPHRGAASDRPGALPRRPRSCPRPAGRGRRARARRRSACSSSRPGGSWCEPASTRESDRQVESRALLSQRRGCEVDGDPVPRGPRQHRVDDAAVHTVLGLLAGAVGEPDDRERGQIGRDEVRLDLDAARLEADDGGGDGACDHTSDATADPCAVSAVPILRRDAGGFCAAQRATATRIDS